MDASGLTSVDTTQRIAGFPRAEAVSWPPKFQAPASEGDTAGAAGAQSRQPAGQAPPQSPPPTPTGLVLRSNAAFLAQSLSQEAGGAIDDSASTYRTAASAYGRLAVAEPQPDNTVEVLTTLPQLASGKSVDLTV